jgi:hypothetical protein
LGSWSTGQLWIADVQDELAKSVTYEQGKTLADARGDVFRGLGECLHMWWSQQV